MCVDTGGVMLVRVGAGYVGMRRRRVMEGFGVVGTGLVRMVGWFVTGMRSGRRVSDGISTGSIFCCDDVRVLGLCGAWGIGFFCMECGVD